MENHWAKFSLQIESASASPSFQLIEVDYLTRILGTQETRLDYRIT